MPLVQSIVAISLSFSTFASARAYGAQDTNSLFGCQNAAEGVCASEQSQPAWYKRNLKTVRAIYDLTVYPNNLPIIQGGGAAVPPGLFAPHATGRVSPVGDFEDFEDSIEYFFALAPTPQSNNASTAFYDAQVVDFTSGCPNVAASLVYFRSGSVDQTGQLDRNRPTSTLSQVSFWHFDDQGRVDKYQSWIPNLQAWTLASSGIDYTNRTIQQGAALGLCPVIQQRCTGKDQVYDSVENCAAVLGSKPFGNFDEAWGDNIACRTIHLLLTVVRPDVHCAHVGPTGGGKCIDIDYSVDYFDDERLFQSPLGSVFTCSGPLQPDNQVGPGPGAAAILQGLAQQQAQGGAAGQAGAMGGQGQGQGGTAANPAAGAAAAAMAGQGQGGTAANPAAGAAAGAMQGQGHGQAAPSANGQALQGLQGITPAAQSPGPAPGTPQAAAGTESQGMAPPLNGGHGGGNGGSGGNAAGHGANSGGAHASPAGGAGGQPPSYGYQY